MQLKHNKSEYFIPVIFNEGKTYRIREKENKMT